MEPEQPAGASEPVDAVQAVREHLAAFNTGDLDALAASFTEDAVFAAGGEVVIGRRAIAGVFADALAAPVEAVLELRRAVVDGSEIACELVERLGADEDAPELAVAAFYSVRNGRLARARVYRDHGAD